MSPKLKKGLKLGGFIAALITYVVFSVLVYYTKNSPPAIDIFFRDLSYNIRGEKYGFGFWFFRIITEFGDYSVNGSSLTEYQSKVDEYFVQNPIESLISESSNNGYANNFTENK